MPKKQSKEINQPSGVKGDGVVSLIPELVRPMYQP